MLSFLLVLELYYIGNEKMCMCTFFLSHELEKEEKVELTEATSFYGEDHEITFWQWNQLQSLSKQYRNKQKN